MKKLYEKLYEQLYEKLDEKIFEKPYEKTNYNKTKLRVGLFNFRYSSS